VADGPAPSAASAGTGRSPEEGAESTQIRETTSTTAEEAMDAAADDEEGFVEESAYVHMDD
jgi:hypothetical protein